MSGIEVKPSGCCTYELEIAINAPREKVWSTLLEDTGSWWLPDFHVAGPESTITFDTAAGGRGLVEENPNGDSLLWFSVHLFQPSQFKIYLIGHEAPEWGGPTTVSLKLAVEETESGCVLKVTDARHGNVSESSVQSYANGWRQLFTDGLKAYVERS